MQSKRMSLLEVTLSTLIGLAIAIITQVFVFPWFGIHVPLHTNFQIAAIFTVVSIIRSFAVRRLFNWLGIRKTIKQT